MRSALFFAKKTDEYVTPDDFYRQLDQEFHFLLDASASSTSTKCDWWFGMDHPEARNRDGLRKPWAAIVRDWDGGAVWVNPPYSKCREFVAKAAAEARAGATVVMLLPARTDTRWWHEHIWDDERHDWRPGVSVRFVKGRLKFQIDLDETPNEKINSAPFPSVVVVFRPVVAEAEMIGVQPHEAIEWP